MASAKEDGGNDRQAGRSVKKQKKRAKSESEEEEGEMTPSERGDRSEEDSDDSAEGLTSHRSEDEADADLTLEIVAKAKNRVGGQHMNLDNAGSARTSGIRTSKAMLWSGKGTLGANEDGEEEGARRGKSMMNRETVQDGNKGSLHNSGKRNSASDISMTAKAKGIQGTKPSEEQSLEDEEEEGEMKEEGEYKDGEENVQEGNKNHTLVAHRTGPVTEKRKDFEAPDDPESSPADPGDNLAMRKLLRGVRYFDPPEEQGELCYNCGGRGHKSFECTEQKRERPCYVCGEFGHDGRECSQKTQCFHCNKVGHMARDCPSKGQRVAEEERGSDGVCMRCGRKGHAFNQCADDYYPEDLKLVQCYVCKGRGHLCCAEFDDWTPDQLSCYNCGETGHLGGLRGCIRKGRHVQMNEEPPAMVCYGCGEEGHMARSCTRANQNGGRAGGSRRDMDGSRSSVTCYNCGGEGHFARDCPSQGAEGWSARPLPPNPLNDMWVRTMYLQQNSNDRSPWHDERERNGAAYGGGWDRGGGMPGGSRREGWIADEDKMGRTWDRGSGRWGDDEDGGLRWHGEGSDSRYGGGQSQGGERGYKGYDEVEAYNHYDSPLPRGRNKADKAKHGRSREADRAPHKKDRSRSFQGGRNDRDSRRGDLQQAEGSTPPNRKDTMSHGQRHNKSSSKRQRR